MFLKRADGETPSTAPPSSHVPPPANDRRFVPVVATEGNNAAIGMFNQLFPRGNVR